MANQSIALIGLAQYLTDTKSEHNDFGYNDFVRMLNTPKDKPVNNSNIARAFGVSRPTILKWIKIYRLEVVRNE